VRRKEQGVTAAAARSLNHTTMPLTHFTHSLRVQPWRQQHRHCWRTSPGSSAEGEHNIEKARVRRRNRVPLQQLHAHSIISPCHALQYPSLCVQPFQKQHWRCRRPSPGSCAEGEHNIDISKVRRKEQGVLLQQLHAHTYHISMPHSLSYHSLTLCAA